MTSTPVAVVLAVALLLTVTAKVTGSPTLGVAGLGAVTLLPRARSIPPTTRETLALSSAGCGSF